MFYHLSNISHHVFKYVTVRTLLAIIVSLCISLCYGERFINFLKKQQKDGQPIRRDGPVTHLETKKGTPTMGGLLIVGSTSLSTLLCADLSNIFVWMLMLLMISFTCIGFLDDFKKLRFKNSKGLSGRQKLFWQSIISIACVYVVESHVPTCSQYTLFFPFFKNAFIHLGMLYLLLSAFVIVGTSNAVNLTDGLDGLAIGPIMISCIVYAIIAYCTGHVHFSHYLHIPSIPGSQEVCVFLGALLGSGLGFLWFNAPPAQVFMGDTGSLPIGGILGLVSIITKHEIILSIVGGVFVIEALSVMIQVGSYKTRQKRVFRMAPIHHHFEKKGWAETKVVFRFWIISIILGLLGLATLKIR